MKLGIALCGGGIRGVAHAGVLKALEENNIKIDAIGGTSSGSIVAALYAMGYSPYYIYILFKRYSKELIDQKTISTITNIKSFLTNKKTQFKGFYTGKEIEDGFKEVALRKGIKNINDINMPIVIPAVDIGEAKEYIFTNNKLNKKNKKYISDIPIGVAVRSSCSFPLFFNPCEYDNHIFLDGGVLNNVPAIEVKKQGVDKVLSVNFRAESVNEESNIMDIMMRTIDVMGSKISEENLSRSDYVLTIKTDKAGLLEIDKLDKCYKFGYKQTINNIDKILKLVNE